MKNSRASRSGEYPVSDEEVVSDVYVDQSKTYCESVETMLNGKDVSAYNTRKF